MAFTVPFNRARPQHTRRAIRGDAGEVGGDDVADDDEDEDEESDDRDDDGRNMERAVDEDSIPVVGKVNLRFQAEKKGRG